MADCNETLREMYLFLDGEIPSGVKGQIEAHLEGCTDCLGAFEFHFELRRTIKQVCLSEQVPPGLADKIAACFPDLAAEVDAELGAAPDGGPAPAAGTGPI